jgi:hypothetical protein
MKKSPAEIIEIPTANSPRRKTTKVPLEDQEDQFVEALERYLRRSVFDQGVRLPRWALWS